MSLPNNPTPNEVVKAIKELETNKLTIKEIGSSSSSDAPNLFTMDDGFYMWKANTYIKLGQTTCSKDSVDGILYFHQDAYGCIINSNIYFASITSCATLGNLQLLYINKSDNSWRYCLPYYAGYINGSSQNETQYGVYAPTTEGTAGQVLKSSGNGAPVWANYDAFPMTTITSSTFRPYNKDVGAYKFNQNTTIYPKGASSSSDSFTLLKGSILFITLKKDNGDVYWFYENDSGFLVRGSSFVYASQDSGMRQTYSITLNGVTSGNFSLYAPTTVGTDGYLLKSNGSGAPTWVDPSTIGGVTLRRWS